MNNFITSVCMTSAIGKKARSKQRNGPKRSDFLVFWPLTFATLNFRTVHICITCTLIFFHRSESFTYIQSVRVHWSKTVWFWLDLWLPMVTVSLNPGKSCIKITWKKQHDFEFWISNWMIYLELYKLPVSSSYSFLMQEFQKMRAHFSSLFIHLPWV